MPAISFQQVSKTYAASRQQRAQGKPGLKARVTRIQSAGAQVRIELNSERGETLHVEMPHARFRERAVAPKDEVFVSFLDARVFLEERQ